MMEACLVEAIKADIREDLANSTIMTICRDERFLRLLVKLIASNGDGEVITGILGQAKNFGAGTATALNRESIRLFRQLATPYFGMPYTDVATKLDDKLYRHLVSITRGCVVDAASNEEAAARMATKNYTAQAVEEGGPLLPNANIIVRDKAHGARRILQRPWDCDDLFKSVITLLVSGKGSIAQKIQNSHVFRGWYEEASRASTEKALTSTFSHLKAARHRFEKNATPLHRIVCDPDANYEWLNRIIVERAGTEDGAHSKSLLEVLDEEVWTVASILADIGDDCLEFIRIWDSPYPDLAKLNRSVKAFLDKMKLLYFNGEVFKVPGHSAFMMDWLKKPHHYWVNGKLMTIGGCADRIARLIENIMPKLKAFVVLVEKVVLAEFPSFEIIAAMNCFDLTEWNSRELTEDRTKDLERLAQAFSVDLDSLKMQFFDHGCVAAKLKREKGLESNAAAWKAAKSQLNDRRLALRHPSTSFDPVHAAYGGLGCSTSGLESDFSVYKRVMGEHRLSAGEAIEEGRLRIMFCPKDKRKNIAKKARLVWKTIYKKSRKRVSARWDKGLPKKVADIPQEDFEDPSKKLCSAGFLRRRRAFADKLAKKATPVTISSEDCGMAWTDKHQAEAAFQAQKVETRKLETLAANGLLPSEMTASLDTKLPAFEQNLKKNCLERERIERRIAAQLKPKTTDVKKLSGLKTFVQHELDCIGFRQALGRVEAEIVQDPRDASLLVYDGVDNMPTLAALAAKLCGLWVVSPLVFMGKPGHIVKFQCALAVRRFIYISPSFADGQPHLSSLLEHCLGQKKIRWKLLSTLEEFVRRKHEAEKKKMEAWLSLWYRGPPIRATLNKSFLQNDWE